MKNRFKVMIIDDEEWILKGIAGIISLLESRYDIIGQYTDSRIALNKIREQEPEVILLDIKMPFISGQMMMEIIREEAIPCEFIIISGYSDFSIAKQAIQHNAFDYILKPINKDELLGAMDRLYNHLLEKEKINQIIMNAGNSEISVNESLQKKIEEMEGYSYYQILLTNKSNVMSPDPIKDVVFSKAVNIYGQRTMWLTASNTKSELCTKSDLDRWRSMNNVAVGISKPGESINEFLNMLRQANCAMCSAYLQEKNDVFIYIPPDPKEVSKWIYKIENSYNTKDNEILYNTINNIVNEWTLHGNPASVSLFIIQITYYMSTLKNISNMVTIEKFLYDDITSQFSNKEEILSYLFHLLDVKEGYGEQNAIPDVIQDVKKYINEHYSEDINLSQLSKRFFISPTYLCELFKKNTGETITSYLLKIRMKNSSDLMTTTNMSLMDISLKIGYNDYNYFSRLFKRFFGVSPTYYRKVQTTK